MIRKTMQSKDAVSSKLAEAYVTIEDKRYLLFQAKKFEAKFDKSKEKVPILGRTGNGNRSFGWNGTGTLVIYHNTSIFDELFYRFKATGEDIYFDMQVTNEDTTSNAGRLTKIYKDCNLDSGQLQSFDAEGKWLEQELSFTFDDYEEPERYKELEGMR